MTTKTGSTKAPREKQPARAAKYGWVKKNCVDNLLYLMLVALSRNASHELRLAHLHPPLSLEEHIDSLIDALWARSTDSLGS